MVCIKALRIFAAKISYNHLIFNIMSECKTVTLRTRPLKKGMLSFYLDYYPGYRDQETMKTIRHEGLNIYIYANPKNQRERDFNAAMSEKAEAIRCRRFEAIVNERYDFFDKRKYKADFLEYYRKQLRRHDQKWGFVYQHFYNFVHGKCTFEEIDVDLCNKFREYLLNAKQLICATSSGNTCLTQSNSGVTDKFQRTPLPATGPLSGDS